MKILILISLFLSMNVFPEVMSLKDVADCEEDGYKYTTYKNQGLCNNNHVDCAPIPSDFNCKIHSNQDTQVDDIDSPIIAKRNLETCIDDDACQAALVIKVCSNPLLTAIKRLDLDPKEIYCPEQVGYNQMTVKRIREDSVKKAIWDAAQALKANQESARQVDSSMLKGLITTLKSGTDLTPLQRRKLYILIIRNLR